MMTSVKTSIFAANPVIFARLIGGEVITSSAVRDERLADEICEGGGCIWWCGYCQAVHSPNRPGACDEDPEALHGWSQPVTCAPEERAAWMALAQIDVD